MMEEGTLPKTEKFHKVEMKLNLLVQSKLQNLTQNGFKQAEERLNIIEKKLIEEITSNDKSSNNVIIKHETIVSNYALLKNSSKKYKKNVKHQSLKDLQEFQK